MHKERKETTHEEIGERNIITTSSNIYIYVCVCVCVCVCVYTNKNTRFAITIHKKNVSKQERKEKIQKVLTTSLKKIKHPP